MIFKNSKSKDGQFWHRFPEDRGFLEKVARRFLIPSYHDNSMTWEGWDRYNGRLKRRFPVRWFLSNDIPDFWTDWVKRPIRSTRSFFRYRTKDRYHIVDTGLEPGYYDSDTRMIHSAFNLLRDYVELELAAMHHAADEAEPSESTHSFYGRIKRFRAKQERDPKAGLAYLDWEIEETFGNVSIGQLTQAEAAQEKKFLYLWWTVYRPQRGDLYKMPLIWSGNGYDETLPVFSQDCAWQYHLVQQLEKFYEDEDEEMLHRLVAIRTRMWS